MHEVTLKPAKRFSVGKIVCVGKNYDEHIKEMHSDRPKTPVLFLKPSTAIIEEGTLINLPAYSKDVHHEIELALLVTKVAQNISKSDWKNYIGGAGIALAAVRITCTVRVANSRRHIARASTAAVGIARAVCFAGGPAILRSALYTRA